MLQSIPVFSLMIAAAALSLLGQVPVQVQKAELAVPFGVVPGHLITVGEYFVFVDEEKPETSIAVSRADLRRFSADGEILTIETAQQMRDRSGGRSSLTIRLPGTTDAAKLMAWFNAVPKPASDFSSPNAKTIATRTYQVKHDHRIGNCTGRLIIEPNRVLFESITDIGHSRQWGMRDIKELKRDNPYGIKIVPFTGDTYNLGIVGKGMDNDEYRALVDRITAARIKQ